MTKERKQMLIQGLACSGLSVGSYILFNSHPILQIKKLNLKELVPETIKPQMAGSRFDQEQVDEWTLLAHE